MIEIAYGAPQVIFLSVLDAEDATAGLTLETDPTLAAADVTIASNRLSSTEMAAEHVAFTSGSVEPTPGDTISGATSSSTATYLGCILTSGTWGAGTAAGTMWVSGASGAFQSENLDNDTTSATNFATIGGDLTDSAIDSAGYTLGIGITASEATCRAGNIVIRDATATEEYLETYIAFRTVGPSSLAFWSTGTPGGTVTGGSPSTTSSGNTDLAGFANDELIGRTITFVSGTADGQAARIVDYVSTNGIVSFTAITTAPAAGDRFRID